MRSSGTDIVIACCRDEGDIIADFIEFYLDQGFDHVCLVDNGSRDGTLKRILDHRSSDRVHLRTDPRLGYDQRLLEYYRGFANLASRWVFFIDVDEFILLPGGIKGHAAHLPAETTVLELPTAEMLPVNGATSAAPLASDRREAEFHTERKVVWTRAAKVRKIYCGKHDIEAEVDRRHHDPEVFIRHYHTRSPDQFRSKLRHRIETDTALDPDNVAELSLFSLTSRRRWIEASKRLLEDDGWGLESQRIAAIEWVPDEAVKHWYTRRDRAKSMIMSPVIPLNGTLDRWHCFCIREFEPAEGHTADEHLVLLVPPDGAVIEQGADTFAGVDRVPVRVHSECLFGDVFGSERCDCGEQLEAAFREIESVGCGIIVYLRQEGRGVGLFDKIRSLVVDNPDTFVRNERVGLPADARGYRLAARVVVSLGVSSVRLLSGNPHKAACLRDHGIDTVVAPTEHLEALSEEARRELQTKVRRGYRYALQAEALNSAKIT